jgi:hypothetical protein
MNASKHLKIAGALQVVSGIMMLLFGIYGVIGNFFGSCVDGSSKTPFAEYIYVISVLALIFLLGGVLTWFGISLVMQKRWTTRVWGFIIGALGFPGFPVGTAISGYTLWVLIMVRREDAKVTEPGNGEVREKVDDIYR